MTKIQKRFGVFTHFLYGNPGSTPVTGIDPYDWNARCNAFDTERLAHDLHEVGADYYFITLMQGRKYMIAPNATFDRIGGTKPGEACATRDLVLDLYDSLSKYGIDLCLYFTGDGPYKDVEQGKRFGFIEPRKNISMSFCQKWAEVLEEYAVRYGDKVKAWWIDGCYTYFGYTEEMLTCYYNAVKKGNPNALVTMNNGVKEDYYRYYFKEDFTSGEFNDFTVIPKSSDIDGSLPHILAPLGCPENPNNPWGGWCRPGVKRDGAYMRDFVSKVNAAGGIVTIDIKINYDSTLLPEQLEVLRQIKD